MQSSGTFSVCSRIGMSFQFHNKILVKMSFFPMRHYFMVFFSVISGLSGTAEGRDRLPECCVSSSYGTFFLHAIFLAGRTFSTPCRKVYKFSRL